MGCLPLEVRRHIASNHGSVGKDLSMGLRFEDSGDLQRGSSVVFLRGPPLPLRFYSKLPRRKETTFEPCVGLLDGCL